MSLMRQLATQAGKLLPTGFKRQVALNLSVRSFRVAVQRCRTVTDYCRLTFDWNGFGDFASIRSLQYIEEEVAYFEYVASKRPKHALEIGTCNGGTLFVLLAVAPDDVHAISVDLPGGIHGGGYDQVKVDFFSRAFCRKGQRLDAIRADSRAPDTLDRVRAVLGDNRLDYLFIDGDHRYPGVRDDFLLYAPFVRKGGMIAFHDIASIHHPSVDSPRLWGRLKANHTFAEFIRPTLNNELLVGGIGVLTDWDPAAIERLRAVVNAE